MKTLSVFLLLSAAAFADGAAVRVLAALADDDATRAAVGAKFEALAVDAIPALDKVLRAVRTPKAQRLLGGLLDKHGKEIRKR
ncbi:MAG: hypothetical protein OER88_13020, partial [Planctomycetota bacterium]|nr:hypothetical protein [Planctomycetota bacterium]